MLEDPAGRLSIGSTGDLEGRVKEHNSPHRPRSKHTAKVGPWTLVWSKAHPTQLCAERDMARAATVAAKIG